MATVRYPSHSRAEVIEIEFLTPAGGSRPVRLMVDTGFTGKSHFVLSNANTDLVWSPLAPVTAKGALQGEQDRGWVVCLVPGLSFRLGLAAVMTNLAQLPLPDGVDGIAGLTFLRRFSRWGAERAADGGWQFFLSEREPNA